MHLTHSHSTSHHRHNSLSMGGGENEWDDLVCYPPPISPAAAAAESTGDLTSTSMNSNSAVDVIAKKETTLLRFWRFVVMDSIVMMSCVYILTTYCMAREQEHLNFESHYEEATSLVEQYTFEQHHVLRETLKEFANVIGSFAMMEAAVRSTRSSFLSLPAFETHAHRVREITDLQGLSVTSLVPSEQYDEWIAYAEYVHQQVLREATTIQSQGPFTTTKLAQSLEYHSYMTQVANATTTTTTTLVRDSDERDYYFPSLLWSPPPSTYTAMNWNMGSDPGFGRTLRALLKLKEELLFTVPSGINPLVVQDKKDEPYTYIMAPIHKVVSDSSSVLVGVVSGAFLWSDFFFANPPIRSNKNNNYMQPQRRRQGSIVVVLKRTNCGQEEEEDNVVSYEIHTGDNHHPHHHHNHPTNEAAATTTTFLGQGAWYDRKFEKYKVSISLSNTTTIEQQAPYQLYTQPNITLATPGHCLFEMDLYPQSNFWYEYVSYDPEIRALSLSILFFIIAVVYGHYDKLVDERNSKLVSRFSRSNAIVASLFPKNFQERLMGYDNTEGGDDDTSKRTTSKTNNNSAFRNKQQRDTLPRSEGSLRDLMDDNDNNNNNNSTSKTPYSKPLAELFQSVTILFADLVGFTAWSSMREPCHVFTLLETLYSNFDAYADSYGIFKVETVGDCYVAASGLPDPRNDHATAMVRFSYSILRKMQVLTKELEVTLGPDTADLALRVGIHSGPVTAGILRGKKARFQLFGDTMNTTSRIETTGKPGRIHVSQATATLLMEAGKRHWLEKRTDEVIAKGKGSIETYWVSSTTKSSSDSIPTTNSKHDDSSTSASSDDDDGDGNVVPTNPNVTSNLTDSYDPFSTLLGSSHHAPLDSEKGQQILARKGSGIVNDRIDRLIEWNVGALIRVLKEIIAFREANGNHLRMDTFHNTSSSSSSSSREVMIKTPRLMGGDALPLDEVKEVLTFPTFIDRRAGSRHIDAEETVEISNQVVNQLRSFIHKIASVYQENPFHNFEHASHGAMSIAKLLRVVQQNVDIVNEELGSPSHTQATEALHKSTYGLSSDPLTQFACIFSALIHDVDHTGVPNSQLVKEGVPVASFYKNRSVAEQNSFDISWTLFMDRSFDELRKTICANTTELQRFRQLVINCVMATDREDDQLQQTREVRWQKAFAQPDNNNNNHESNNNTTTTLANQKATLVIEHLMHMPDLAHTMQHWQIYQKWNQRSFLESYRAYKLGRAEKDPRLVWYEKEMDRFDSSVLPLARKLKECGIFGVSGEDCLQYALNNRKSWASRGMEIVDELIKMAEKEFESLSLLLDTENAED